MLSAPETPASPATAVPTTTVIPTARSSPTSIRVRLRAAIGTAISTIAQMKSRS